MLLSGERIRQEVRQGRIVLDPFRPSALNPNSINLRLGHWLWVYEGLVLDMARENRGRYIEIRPEGFELRPGKLYLGTVMEHLESPVFCPMIEGRSSVGRLGLSVHAAAGFGDRGFRGCFTLELTTVLPLRVYAGIEVAQLCFHEVDQSGPVYEGKYRNDRDLRPIPSHLWKEFRDGQPYYEPEPVPDHAA